jgi:hypothetical protein
VPVWLFAYAAQTDWTWHPWLKMTILAMPVFGIMWLYDELTGR